MKGNVKEHYTEQSAVVHVLSYNSSPVCSLSNSFLIKHMCDDLETIEKGAMLLCFCSTLVHPNKAPTVLQTFMHSQKSQASFNINKY